MGRRRTPLRHPLTQLFERAAESLTTALGESSVSEYLGTVHLFLTYLGTHHPQVCALEQLQRDPHILDWLVQLRSRKPPLAKLTLALRIVRLRRLLEELAWNQQVPALAHLLTREDIPRREHLLPRPLTPEQDQCIQEELERRNDLASNTLLLLRYTGMRIGECVDLSLECVRPLGRDQWVLHVPLGKLGTERWVPVDSRVCQIVDRLRSLRQSHASDTGRLLLPRPRGRYQMIRGLRAYLQEAAAAAGIKARIVPHQFRHTYASEMLRAGVSLPAVVKLLGHKSPRMTLQYIEITQQDLQREYHRARSQPRHLVPTPRGKSLASQSSVDLAGLLDSLRSTQHLLEMFRRSVAETQARHLLDRLANRLLKIVTETRKLKPPEK
jgi:site-specific recombinase XerD